MKEFVIASPVITVLCPLLAVFFIESKINRLYNFSNFHSMLSNCLTAMVGLYFFIQIVQKPNDK